MWGQLFPIFCQYFVQAASLSVFWSKTEIVAPTAVNFWPGGLVYQMACVPKMKGFIVVIAEYFYCLLTLHSLDSNFENRLLLSQQPFHHRAKLPWRKKLKHKQTVSLDAISDAATERLVSWLKEAGARLWGYHTVNCYTTPRVKTFWCQTEITWDKRKASIGAMADKSWLCTDTVQVNSMLPQKWDS